MGLTVPMIASIAVVILVVYFQWIKFTQNRNRIELFSKIFSGQDYDLEKDTNGLVVGITGTGNEIFDDIKSSINGYLGGTQGTEVDFELLKDSVDRHCDMIEDEINSQMPLPLYFGLAGTMTGAIIGLFALVFGGAIRELMTGGAAVLANNAANNINDLLWGVAIAMVASAIGIVMTSLNTIYFKDKKLQEETEKNKFLAWMQSRVLSAVPSGVSQQMRALVTQLSTFNRNFKANTDAINLTLGRAKEVYQSQADVIEQYKAIDLEGIANGVSSIMRRLRSSTESLDNFTQYLETVHEYYEELQVFANKLNQETERIAILQDIQRFFQSHKSVIAEETTEAHKNIQESLVAVQSATEQQVNETYTALTEQSVKLKEAIKENNEQFASLCQEMRTKFQQEMNAMPALAQNMKKLEEIPGKLDTVVNSITASQDRLANKFIEAANKIISSAGKGKGGVPVAGPQTRPDSAPSLEIPSNIKWTVIVCVILMTLATIGNTAYNIWRGEKASEITVGQDEASEIDSTNVVVPAIDSTKVAAPAIDSTKIAAPAQVSKPISVPDKTDSNINVSQPKPNHSQQKQQQKKKKK